LRAAVGVRRWERAAPGEEARERREERTVSEGEAAPVED
jgi:hypothetical protein